MPGMSLERFAELAEAYGGDFERWPEAERIAAISLAGRSEEARSQLADAHGLDYLLERFGTPPAPSDALVERVTARKRESGGTAETHRIGVSVAATDRRGLFPAMRSNALMLSVLLNVVLAGALGGVWIWSGPAPGTASEAAYVQADVEAMLPGEAEAGLAEELGTPLPEDPGFAEFDAESSDDFEMAGWPDEDQPSIAGISSI